MSADDGQTHYVGDGCQTPHVLPGQETTRRRGGRISDPARLREPIWEAVADVLHAHRPFDEEPGPGRITDAVMGVLRKDSDDA